MTKILQELWKKGFIVSADAAEILSKINIDLNELMKEMEVSGATVITKQTIEKIIKLNNSSKIRLNNKDSTIHKTRSTIHKSQISTKKTGILKFFDDTNKVTIKIKKEITVEVKREVSSDIQGKPSLYNNKHVEIIPKKTKHAGEEYELSVDVIKNYKNVKQEVTINIWASYFRTRLRSLKKLLRNHSELSIISSFDNLTDGDSVGVVGLVNDIKKSQKGILFKLEDSRGYLKVFVPNDIEDFDKISSIPLDSVIGVVGTYNKSKKMLFADKVFYPDVPYRTIKKGEEDIWIAFTGDFQIGNKKFLRKPFERFIKWLKGEYGSKKERAIAKKVGYLIITGDLVDGVGIYPNQQEELELITIEDQYKTMENYFLEIPEYIQTIVIPGNHDAVRLAEPQPPISKRYLPDTYDLNNFYYLSNPTYVKLHNIFTVLIYHGYSMDWFVSEIPIVRNNGGYDKPGEIMKFMLMLRHLCPTHGSNPYIPYPNEDSLVIDPLPDIFVTGHIHKTDYSIYKGIELINASCFQGITQYQIELGHTPDPGKVILRNIKTGEVKIVSFMN